MIRHFIAKEFFETVVGPKFLITFAISAILIVISIISGHQLYESEMKWYVKARNENLRSLENVGSYGDIKRSGTKAIREPAKMSIFVRGVDSSIGKASNIGEDPSIILRDSRFGLNPIFAVFGELDLAFITKIIMALFAILFSYNAITGERENGTLKLIMSTSASRVSLIIGKTIGGLLTLVVTFVVPLIIGLLYLIIAGIDFSPADWGAIGMMTLVFCLYIAVFYMIGMFMSAITRHSFASFLLSLFLWVLCIVIIPKGAVELAGQIHPAPSIDAIEAERSALQREYYQQFKSAAEENYRKMTAENKSDGSVSSDGRDTISQIIDKAQEDAKEWRNGKLEPLLASYSRDQLRLTHLAELISRVSPTACVTHASSRLSHTDVQMRERFIESLKRFQTTFLEDIDKRIEKEPDKRASGISIGISPDGLSIRVPDETLGLQGFPDFKMQNEKTVQSISATLPDIAILAFQFLLFFSGSFVAFIRYDVR